MRCQTSILLLLCCGVMTGGCGGDQPDTTPTGDAPAGAADVAAALDDAEYLVQIGLMRGHLLVGNALLEQGEQAAALTHAKHPADELYTGIEPSFAARGAVGFAAELQAHADALTSGDTAAAATTYGTLTTAIDAAERAVAVPPDLAAKVIARLLDEAAREYAIGIVDGVLANAHEYQDAWGFTRIAQRWTQRMAANASGDAQGFAQLAARLDELADLWPALVPPPTLDRTAEPLLAAAATARSLAVAPS